MSGRGITGICLAVCGVLTVIWGGAQGPVDVTSPDFMSFATGGMVLLVIGALLIPGAAEHLHHRRRLGGGADVGGLHLHPPGHRGAREADQRRAGRRPRRLADHQGPELTPRRNRRK